MAKSFQSVFMGAAGGGVELPSDDEFNRVSSLLHFDGSNNGTNNVYDDSSSSNHTITASGDVTQGSFGPFARPDGEWAVSFDGTDDRLSAPDSADFDFGEADFTVELFFNYKGSIANRWLIGGAAKWQLRLKTASSPSRLGEISFWTGFSEIIYVSSADLADSAWHHLAITREGTTLRHFLDGALVKTTTNSDQINLDSGSALYIGASSTNSQDWDGHISNVRVVKGTAVYTSAFTTPTAPLTAVTNTKLLTCQSNRFVDNSTSAHTITPSGNAAVSAFGPFLTSSVYSAGVNGASAYFDGSDKLSSSASTDYELGTGDLTVEYWAYPTASGVIQNILDNRAEASGWKLGRNASNQFQVYNEVTSSYLFESGTFPENAWSHFCWTRASGVNKFFINGVQSGGNVSDSSNFDSNSLNIGVQHGGTTQYFTGYITCCRVIKGTAVEPSGVPSAPPTAVTNTKLLLNMADGQAIDSAAQNNLTLFGNAKISSTQSKFGGTSLALDGTGDYAALNDSDAWAFGTGDFTVETWIYLNGTPGTNAYIFDMRNASQTEYTWALSFNYMGTTTDKLQWASNNTSPNAILTADYPPLNQWVHIAVCRSGTTTRMFYNGTQSAINTSDSADYRNTGYAGYIGARHSVANFIDAFYDDIRFSKVARYTSNFTPPTEPFADKGQ